MNTGLLASRPATAAAATLHPLHLACPLPTCPPAALPCSFLNEASLLDLPDSIGSLAALRKLRLNQNALRSLPPSLTGLHQLQALWAAGNVFREVPQVRRCSA